MTIFNAYDARRTNVDFGIGFRDNLDDARRLMIEAIRGVAGVLEDPAPSAICAGVGTHSIAVRARWWTDSKQTDDVAVKDKVIPAIKERLLENGIDVAYPTQQILFHDQTEEVDGDRRRQRAGWPAGRGDVPRPRRIGDALSRFAETVTQAGGNGNGHAPISETKERG